MSNSKDTVMVSVASERAEALAGVLIAVVAALMAFSELINNNLEEEMMIAHNNHNSYFSWYQSKSIKQSLKESEYQTLEMIVGEKPSEKAMEKLNNIKEDIKKYSLEKNEILKGSANVPSDEWVQDLEGEMGQIIGVNEWEQIASKLDQATQKFDIGMLFFQISLVLGAVCVIIYDNPRLQKSFIVIMLFCAAVGIGFSVHGYFLSV